MFGENILVKIMGLLCLVMIIGAGSASASMPLIGSQYWCSQYQLDQHHLQGFLLGGLSGIVLAGSGLFLWNTVGPGRRKDNAVDKKMDYSRSAANAFIPAIAFSMLGALVVAGTLGLFPHIAESGFLKLVLVVGLMVPAGVFLHLRNSLSTREAVLTSALEFGFSLIIFPLSLALMLALSNLFFPPPVYVL